MNLLILKLRRLLLFWGLLAVDGLDTEIDNRSANLHGFVEVRQNGRGTSDQDESSELAHIVLEQEAVLLILYEGMASADRNVIDPQVSFMASAQLERLFGRRGLDHVDDSRGVLLLFEAFQH